MTQRVQRKKIRQLLSDNPLTLRALDKAHINVGKRRRYAGWNTTIKQPMFTLVDAYANAPAIFTYRAEILASGNRIVWKRTEGFKPLPVPQGHYTAYDLSQLQQMVSDEYDYQYIGSPLHQSVRMSYAQEHLGEELVNEIEDLGGVFAGEAEGIMKPRRPRLLMSLKSGLSLRL